MEASTRARRHAVVSGVVAALLFAIGNLIWALDMPEDGTAIAEVVSFYEDGADQIVIGGSLSLLSIAAGIWFAGAFRQVMTDDGADEFIANIAFAGLLLGLASGLIAEGINMIGGLRAQDDELTPELAQAVFEIPQMFGAPAGGIGFGVAAIAIAVAALRSGAVLGRRTAIVTAVVGVLLLSPLAHVNSVTGIAMILLLAMIVTALLRRPSVVDP